MEEQQKIKAKIPVKRKDGSFSFIESTDTAAPTPQPPKKPAPAKPQPIPPKPPVSQPPQPKADKPPAKLDKDQAPLEDKPIYKPKVKEDQKSSWGQKADFFYSKDDEDEVKAHKDKLSQFGSDQFVTDGQRVTEIIIQEFNLTFSDDIFRKRLIAIVNARLKDIRDFIETKEMLTRSEKVGGMGYEQDLAEKVLKKIEEEATALHGHPLPKVHDRPKPQKEEPIKPPVPEKIKPPGTKQPAAEPAKPKFSQAPQPIVKKVPKPIPAKQKPQQAPQAPSMPQVRRPDQSTGRPRMDDIKKPAKVQGPVEEIGEMNLHDFRRLGENAKSRIDKLAEKISLLEEDSYAKKAEGIKAWKNSPLYKMYLEIGQESMAQNKPIQSLIQEKTQQNQPVISNEEFELITDFNKSLRF